MIESEVASRRVELVQAAAKRWIDSLVDLGGRNNLIYYRDLKAGTLDFEGAHSGELQQLLAGHQVRLSRLFPSSPESPTPVRQARTIRKKIQELDEERGIRAGYLASGMATWDDPEGRRAPNAPVLLRQVTLEPVGGAQEDFHLNLAEEVEINPVLLHLLATQFAVHIDGEELETLVNLESGMDPQPVLRSLAKQASSVPGFDVNERVVIGTFSYAKLPMVADLEANLELMVGNDVVAAIAGDPEAARSIRGDISEPDDDPLDLIPPADEFLILDADSSQSRAINSVVAGDHLVVKGPPGTGKSQTIANLIASLTARGRKVLFVAEKRAAIEAVLSRLDHVGLGDLVMDVHDGASHRRRTAEALARALDQAARVPPADVNAIHSQLRRTREHLVEHNERLHRIRQPWGITLFQAQAQALATPEHLRSATRFRGPVLEALTAEVIGEAQRTLGEFVQLGGIDPDTSSSPWSTSEMTRPEEAAQALATASQIATITLPKVRTRLQAVVTQTGLRTPVSLVEWRQAFDLLDRVAAALSVLRPEVFEQDLRQLAAATGARGYRKQTGVELGFFQRRRLTKLARTLWLGGGKPKTAQLHAELVAASEQLNAWRAVATDGGLPRLPTDLPGAEAGYAGLTAELQALGAHVATTELFNLQVEDVATKVNDLAADVATLQKMPRLNQLRGWLTERRLTELVTEASGRSLGPIDAQWLLMDAWYRSILEHVGIHDPNYGAFSGPAHQTNVTEYVEADLRHRDSTAHRVQRAAAENLVQALNDHDDQARLIRAEASKRTRHKPLRDLWKQAPDVLLAVKPCWAMSPLVVSQVLPAQEIFDVVIFDEASQVMPADSIPAIMRGRQTVVAGDERQLPPTNFFSSAGTEAEEPDDFEGGDGDLEVAMTAGFESILDVLTALMPWRALTWHYRSRDERLIAFSNVHIYDSSLVTFPGVTGESCLGHVHVEQTVAAPGQEQSVATEAEAVVDLVIAHAEDRPEETLGVITMGMKHAERIENELLNRLTERPDLNDFFAADQEERFFVKNLERVQGDERDAIILSIGYGKGPDGRMRYHWGPLNQKGGERRLNVAVTRAKSRLTLVSSFTAADVNPNSLRAEGAKLLRAYLEFASSGGSNLGSGLGESPELNPFEIDVRDQLTRAGVPLVAQYGVSGYRIDFAAAHPTLPGRMVLAIEADGASYHSSQSARDRDRLRQQHLENLGWTFHRIWSTDWFRDSTTEVAKVRLAYDNAVAAADGHAFAIPTSRHQATTPTDIPPPVRTAPEPDFRPGLPITEYSPQLLRQIVRWIKSDGLLRTDEDILREVMAVLWLSRAGSRIRSAIETAIRAER